ncbi:MAG: hypothetical protein A2W91_20235 [Bacteroidetes bacterium GWF2_38_335]|nr:MAG: hypothetical protein A2W91_20235 [Bacteroidetes bacterium GWF2_38_335]OFY79510.1 MAG: hypothetical protein A2281_13850 [Bacteroidetes bacterium RIFOXYA12_FULL_38_20]HBS86551.1 hypothetical protein [Bacteroidales bacterium]
MNLQYIQDSSGKPTGVFIPIKDWEKLKDSLLGTKKSAKDNSKKKIFEDLLKAVEEVNLAKQGRTKLKSFDDFLNEL